MRIYIWKQRAFRIARDGGAGDAKERGCRTADGRQYPSSQRIRLAVLLSAVLAACGGGEFEDIDQFMDEKRTRPGGVIPSVPPFKTYEAFAYSAATQRSPFDQAAETRETGQPHALSAVKPDGERPRELPGQPSPIASLPRVVDGGEFTYTDNLLSFDFQDIEVRTVLQLIADVAEQNLVASDAVSGRITLRLQDVPWEQALELVLKTSGLDKRRVGGVLMVGTVAEIAERERQDIETRRQIAELTPLHTELIHIRHASADDVAQLFEAGGKGGEGSDGPMLSARGSVVVDTRTNALIVTDTEVRLTALRGLIDRLDIPVRQVMIEAQIVIAQSDVSDQLGIRWGGAHKDGSYSASAGLGNLSKMNESMDIGGGDGKTLHLNLPDALLVDLGVSAATSSFALGYASSDLFLAAELSALEAQGIGEVISQPKVITGDKQKASIKSGTEVPYQQSSANGETTVAFKEAVLRLDVTPNITPDDRVLLTLEINQDSLGSLVPSGSGGAIPTIDTTELNTQVLVGNGETVVLGGVFRTEDVESITAVPLLGDIPLLGRLFKNTHHKQTKTETLIFVTPHILAEDAAQ